MNNPYEDLEYLSEFLPEEGESVIISRRRGQLVCESYLEPMHSQYTNGPALIDRELYGRLTMADTRLRVIWQAPAIVAVLTFYLMSLTVHRMLSVGWSGWYLDLGLALLIGVTCYHFIQSQRRRYFLTTVCPALQKWMLDHQLDKYTLIAWLTMHRNLSALKEALTRWT